MTDKAFVDTNILVYARDRSFPEKQAKAFSLLKALWVERRGCTGVQNLNEYFVTVTRKLKPGLSTAEAWQDVQNYFSWNPVELTVGLQKSAWEVQTRYGLSWWDSLVVAAAKSASCRILYTEDLQDGQDLDGLLVRNPFLTGTLSP